MARKRRAPKKAGRLVISPEVLGIALLAVAGFTLCSLLSISRGALTEGWLSFLRQVLSQ